MTPVANAEVYDWTTGGRAARYQSPAAMFLTESLSIDRRWQIVDQRE
jgi:hypothetical protein